MHFLEQYLMQHTVSLYATALGCYGLSLLLYVYSDGLRLRVAAVSSASPLKLKERLSRTVFGALLFLVPGLFLQNELRALFVGGFIVLQLASISAVVSSLAISRALLLPNATTGQIVYSAGTQARLMAGNMLGLAVLCGGTFLLTGSPSFFAGGLYLALTGVGYKRRAGRYDRRYPLTAEESTA